MEIEGVQFLTVAIEDTDSIKLLGEQYLRGTTGFKTDASNGTTFWLRLPKTLTM
jgi:hypothetical protein